MCMSEERVEANITPTFMAVDRDRIQRMLNISGFELVHLMRDCFTMLHLNQQQLFR